MALRGIKPSSIQKRLKCLFFGAAGVGKTTAAIQFPAPYVIDTEKGAENAQYCKMIEDQGGAIFQTSDYDEVFKEVRALLVEKHPYKTLVIDPLTVIYNDLLDKFSENPKLMTHGRHYQEVNKLMKRLLSMILRLDMNVIITSHAKNEYGEKMEVKGQTFDCYKKLDHIFDLGFEIKIENGARVAKIIKSRVEGFPSNQFIPFSYEEIAKRYGRQAVEKETVPESLATKEQLMEFTHLSKAVKLPEDVVEKWLSKAGVDHAEDMNRDVMQKCIDFMKNKITKEDLPEAVVERAAAYYRKQSEMALDGDVH